MRVALLAQQALPRNGSVLAGVLRLLRGWGVKVDILLPGAVVPLHEVRIHSDVYLLQCVDDALVSLAAGLEAAGAVCLNPVPVVRAARDRIATAGALAGAGVPVPQSWSAQRLSDLAHLLDDGPVVVRPGRVGSPLEGRVLRTAEELLEVPASPERWLVQRHHTSRHRTRSVHRVGSQVFGVKLPVGAAADRPVEPFDIDDATRALTDALVDVLGTDLFGVDVLLTEEGPLVVGVHAFPGLQGVPHGALRLAEYVHAVLRQVTAEAAPKR